MTLSKRANSPGCKFSERDEYREQFRGETALKAPNRIFLGFLATEPINLAYNKALADTRDSRRRIRQAAESRPQPLTNNLSRETLRN